MTQGRVRMSAQRLVRLADLCRILGCLGDQLITLVAAKELHGSTDIVGIESLLRSIRSRALQAVRLVEHP